jgi:hypothetical protein
MRVFILDSTMTDQETPRMLRSCYLYALYAELCHNRGEIEGKLMCSKILQVSFNKEILLFFYLCRIFRCLISSFHFTNSMKQMLLHES